MLKQETKDKIKTLGFDVDKLIEAIRADIEVDYAVPEVVAIKQADLDTRDQQKIAEGKRTGETEGEKKGKELASKAFKKKFGLDENLPADIDKVIEAVNAKLNKGDAGMQEQINALLKDKETLAAEKTELLNKAKSAQADASLISSFPTNRTGDLKDAERLLLMKSDLTFEEVEGKTVVKRNGEIVKDKNSHAPLAPSQVIADYFTERKWVGNTGGTGGRGGSDTPPTGGVSGIKSLSKFTEKWTAENPGKNTISPEFQNELNAYSKDVKDFDFYN